MRSGGGAWSGGYTLAPCDPVDHHRRRRRTAGRDRLHRYASQHGCERVVPRRRRDARARTEQEFADAEAYEAKWHEEDKKRFHAGTLALGRAAASPGDGLVNSFGQLPWSDTAAASRDPSIHALSANHVATGTLLARRGPFRIEDPSGAGGRRTPSRRRPRETNAERSSPSRWRFCPLDPVTFRFRVLPPG